MNICRKFRSFEAQIISELTSARKSRREKEKMLGKILLIAASVFVVLHGLIHIIGFIVYSLGIDTQQMAYKTTLLNGAWNVGTAGIFIYGLLWLLPLAGFGVAAIGMWRQARWWRPVMLAVSLVSLVLTALDWQNAYLGSFINLGIMGAVLMTSVTARARRRLSFELKPYDSVQIRVKKG